MKTCVRARVSGRVQGVGFRPTVFRYATQFGLCGYVCNTPEGVIIEVEGEELIVGAFFHQLASAPPKQALISEFQKEVCDSKGYKRFEVVESEPDGDPAVHIAPDLATCDDCLHELFDPSNRRNGHAFINCTDCGPRFTIVRDLPYDRDRTSMSKFPMCEPCDHEYHNPRDRRFHADGCWREVRRQLFASELRAGTEPKADHLWASRNRDVVDRALPHYRQAPMCGFGGIHSAWR